MEYRAFDWVKAAKLIKKLKPMHAEAGIQEYDASTRGCIYCATGAVKDDYGIALATTWGTPVLILETKPLTKGIIPCYKEYEDDSYNIRYNTVWPEEALEILK